MSVSKLKWLSKRAKKRIKVTVDPWKEEAKIEARAPPAGSKIIDPGEIQEIWIRDFDFFSRICIKSWITLACVWRRLRRTIL